MDHQPDSDSLEEALSGFRLSWPGHDADGHHRPAHHRGGSLMERLSMGLSGRRGLTGWPVKLSSPSRS